MRLDIFVEEPSAAAALKNLVPAILGPSRGTLKIRTVSFQGYDDLIKSLPARLCGLKVGAPADWRILVIVDEDRADCQERKRTVENILKGVGLITGVGRQGGSVEALCRIAVEEIEAWLLGDPIALSCAYPRLGKGVLRHKACQRPDQIAGGTWEALEKILQSAGYHPGGLPKIEAADKISRHMDPYANRSPSFACFRDGLSRLVGASASTFSP